MVLDPIGVCGNTARSFGSGVIAKNVEGSFAVFPSLSKTTGRLSSTVSITNYSSNIPCHSPRSSHRSASHPRRTRPQVESGTGEPQHISRRPAKVRILNMQAPYWPVTQPLCGPALSLDGGGGAFVRLDMKWSFYAFPIGPLPAPSVGPFAVRFTAKSLLVLNDRHLRAFDMARVLAGAVAEAETLVLE